MNMLLTMPLNQLTIVDYNKKNNARPKSENVLDKLIGMVVNKADSNSAQVGGANIKI